MKEMCLKDRKKLISRNKVLKCAWKVDMVKQTVFPKVMEIFNPLPRMPVLGSSNSAAKTAEM